MKSSDINIGFNQTGIIHSKKLNESMLVWVCNGTDVHSQRIIHKPHMNKYDEIMDVMDARGLSYDIVHGEPSENDGICLIGFMEIDCKGSQFLVQEVNKFGKKELQFIHEKVKVKSDNYESGK